MRLSDVTLVVGLFGFLMVLYGYFNAQRTTASTPSATTRQQGRRDWLSTLLGAVVLAASLIGGWLLMPR